MFKNNYCSAIAFALFASACSSCCQTPPNTKTECASLDEKLTWHGTNRDNLNQMMHSLGKCSEGYSESKKPIAMFDWDNTVVKNDVGDATFFYLLAHDLILQPPNKNWRFTSRYLTSDATTALDTACANLAAAQMPLPTATNTACAKEILTIYADGKTTTGRAAFAGWDYRRTEPSYAWLAQLLGGRTKADIQNFAQSAKNENLNNPIDTMQTIGGVQVTHWVRVYDQIKDLVAKLQQNGFDVWIASASPQPIVEVWATNVGVNADRVIGIRNIETAGKYDYNLQGCGDVPNGTNDGASNVTGNSMITYIDGKRCWINKVVHGDNSATAMTKLADASRRHAFAAGDSDTDIAFMQDATTLKLAINRNKKELMCNAYANAGGKWLVNPMFIAPKTQQTASYPCSTTGCKDSGGASVPCRDENGQVIADQKDTVF